MPLPVPLLLIENVGKIDPLGEQLAVSSVMVEPNWFVMGLKFAVTCAEAAPEPAIARMLVRKTPAQIVRKALIVETMVALFPSQALHRADLLLLLFGVEGTEGKFPAPPGACAFRPDQPSTNNFGFYQLDRSADRTGTRVQSDADCDAKGLRRR